MDKSGRVWFCKIQPINNRTRPNMANLTIPKTIFIGPDELSNVSNHQFRVKSIFVSLGLMNLSHILSPGQALTFSPHQSDISAYLPPNPTISSANSGTDLPPRR